MYAPTNNGNTKKYEKNYLYNNEKTLTDKMFLMFFFMYIFLHETRQCSMLADTHGHDQFLFVFFFFTFIDKFDAKHKLNDDFFFITLNTTNI